MNHYEKKEIADDIELAENATANRYSDNQYVLAGGNLKANLAIAKMMFNQQFKRK